MEIMNIYSINWSIPHKDAVIGIYYPNGVFEETDVQSGISFTLDQLLYLALCQEITDTGNGSVRCFTNHAYSAFLIQCKPEQAQKNLLRGEKILFGAEFDADAYLDELSQWVEHQRKYAKTQPTPLDSLYYAKRLPGTPLSKTQSARLNRMPSFDELMEWHRRFVRSDRSAVFISGALAEENTIQAKVYNEGCTPRRYAAEKITLPKCIPWKRSELVISIPYEITSNNILATEAVCCWLDPVIARTANRLGCKAYPMQYCPDFFSELQIRIQCPRGKESQIVEEITRALKAAPKEIGDKEINKLRGQVQNYYYSKASDPVEWNRIAGYNAMSGNRHSLTKLLNGTVYEQAISADTILGVMSDIQHTEPSVFATAAR